MIKGKRFEVPNIYRKQTRITLRYASWDLSSVDIIDSVTKKSIATLFPIDKTANAKGKRKLLVEPKTPVKEEAPESETPPLLLKLLADHAATGLPQSYLSTKDELE